MRHHASSVCTVTQRIAALGGSPTIGASLVITGPTLQVLVTRPALASLRCPASSRAARRSMTPPSAAGGPLFETAVVLPALVPTLVRGALAGVVVYSTLQWSFARKFRQEVGCSTTLCADLCSNRPV